MTEEETPPTERQQIKERSLNQSEYNVRHKYSEKMYEPASSIPVELRTLAMELWGADPDLEILSLDPLLHPITGIDEFPTSAEESFFSRVLISACQKLTFS
jgi:hypothetical protein